MAEIVDLKLARLEKKAAAAFGPWPGRLGYKPRASDSFADLPDSVLSALAEVDHAATMALYDLVMGVRDWGRGENFHGLDPRKKLEALDAFLFLADQVRFEMLRRLGWAEALPLAHEPILEIALDYKSLQDQMGPNGVPALLPRYPRFPQVKDRLEYEPAVVVRSIIPEALMVFRRRVKGA